jgi:transcriptional regulator with XRE-family HTH domain
MKFTQRFGNRLRYLRLEVGLSQEQLAERLEVSTETVSNLERGVHAPNFFRLEPLAESLDVDIHELFENIPPE